jgi:mitochondrial fission protein ELM1
MHASPDSSAKAHPPRTWLVLGERPGDNAQVLALGRALGWPTEVKQIRYDQAEKTKFKHRGVSLIGVDLAASDRLEAPWPEAIIAIGRRSVPVTRWIREQAQAAGMNPLHVHLGRPRANVGLFDLVVTTPQYRLPEADNVVEISLPIVFVDGEELGRAAARWHESFAHLPRPWHAVLVGGPTPQLAFGVEEGKKLLARLADWQRRQGGSLLVTTSPRTSSEVEACLRAGLGNQDTQLLLPFVAGGDNPYRALLALADDFVVSIDSASMVAEVATRRKPIYLFDLPTIPPKKKPGLKAALRRAWRQRRKRRQDAGLRADLLDRVYDAKTRLGKVRPRRDIGQLIGWLIETGIAVPLPDGGQVPPVTNVQPGPSQELEQVLDRIQGLWRDRNSTQT